jgi:hypothetical protein
MSEQLHADLQHGADTGRRVFELSGVGPGELNQLSNALGLHAVAGDEHQWQPGDHADRREIAERIVGKVAIKMRIDRQRAVDHRHQRVAVGRGFGDLTGGDAAVAGRLILDDHGLAHGFRQPVHRHSAGDKVAGAAGGRRHDEMGRFGGVGVLGGGQIPPTKSVPRTTSMS